MLMQRSATSCFAGRIAVFLVRPFGEYPAFLILTALLPLFPDIIRFFQNEMSFVLGRNLFYGTLLSLFRAWLLTLPLCLRPRDKRGGESLHSGSPVRSTAHSSYYVSASSPWPKVFC